MATTGSAARGSRAALAAPPPHPRPSIASLPRATKPCRPQSSTATSARFRERCPGCTAILSVVNTPVNSVCTTQPVHSLAMRPWSVTKSSCRRVTAAPERWNNARPCKSTGVPSGILKPLVIT